MLFTAFPFLTSCLLIFLIHIFLYLNNSIDPLVCVQEKVYRMLVSQLLCLVQQLIEIMAVFIKNSSSVPGTKITDMKISEILV